MSLIIKFFLENKLVTLIFLSIIIVWGLMTAPFNWNLGIIPNDPVPVDAIPDIGENQQIVFSEWMGRSPEDVEDQVTYPLTTALLGMPGVKSIRSTSMFGFSNIFIIFNDDVEYYWSRSRILEKLNSLPVNMLPDGVQPKLGPDATALGQVFFYTLEGRDEHGEPAGGWDLHELRSIQDFYVKYGLGSVEGVAEVASIGGHIKEYQVDLDPVAMKAHSVSMMAVMDAIRKSNLDVGANTIEINMVEYLVRGKGYIEKLNDIEEAVVGFRDNVPLRIKDIAKVNIGPAMRSERAILDKGGAEAVGGVVVARYGDNPMQVIENIKSKIDEMAKGMPSKYLDDGRLSKVTIVPFYDRSNLIKETLATLYDAIYLQILITIIVIMVMVYNLRASILISVLLPFAVLMCFVFMKQFQVDANIVALSGIAIAIGTMVDLGIILNENILKHLELAPPDEPKSNTIFKATKEVAPAILTAVSTTIISFVPVFALQSAEGKLFGPLAYTKSFALIASVLFTLLIMPSFARWFLASKIENKNLKRSVHFLLFALGLLLVIVGLSIWGGLVIAVLSINNLLKAYHVRHISKYHGKITLWVTVLAIAFLLSKEWLPLGTSKPFLLNLTFIGIVLLMVLGGFSYFIKAYPYLLNWSLQNKLKFLLIPFFLIFIGGYIWVGFDKMMGAFPKAFGSIGINVRTNVVWSTMSHSFPGLGKEFMPSLNEGSFLLMPTTMPHSGVEANSKVLKQMDLLVGAIPEVEMVVGKAGRAESALDPAPLSMFENIINYKSEFKTDVNGKKLRFKIDRKGDFVKGDDGNLIEDENGQYFRQWRKHIQSPDDIWNEIVKAIEIPGLTSAPKLQPIETRLVMLQTGMRAPMGLKVYGPDLQTIETFSGELERVLKEVPTVKAEAVFADRSLGKPYLEIKLIRNELGRYGLNVADVQDYMEMALGGMALTQTVEGRERYAIRARYAREWRDDPEAIKKILIPTPTGIQVPLGQIAEIAYKPGPMMIRGEDSFLVGYVLFDKKEGHAEVSVVEEAQEYLQAKIVSGELKVPSGISYKFSGGYENQLRASKRLALIVPLCLASIFLILYFQFRSVAMALFIFSAIAMAFAGGFIMLWLYGQNWFMNFDFLGQNMRDLFQMRTINLSVAVWVGFIALFGIATDDGVVIGTYLTQKLKIHQPKTKAEIRKVVLEAGTHRIRPCLMTTATTLLALLPILTSSGKGSDIMVPMAIPTFGGMVFTLISLFIVPVLYSWWQEREIKSQDHQTELVQ